MPIWFKIAMVVTLTLAFSAFMGAGYVLLDGWLEKRRPSGPKGL